MFKQFTNRVSRISHRVVIVAALIGVVAISGIALLLARRGSNADANTSVRPYAARLDRVDGSVGIARAEATDDNLDWTEATINAPVSVGDRVYSRKGAHASIALTGHDYVRLNEATALDVLSLEESRTQLALRSGSALFDVGPFETDEFYEVATPYGAVDFTEPGLYQVGIDDESAIITVLSGLAQVVGQEGSGSISKGQVLTLVGAAAAQALSARVAPDLAGNIVDDYYRDRYAGKYDGRYRSYDAYLDDPYYDPYGDSLSSRYLSDADIPGAYELDSYGDWVDVNNYGHCWAPRVDAGWAPYRSGYWDLDDLWGPSWVSSEQWGWAPYHYGRWAFANQRWFWVPGELRSRHDYCPAPVAFIPLRDEIAWVPLGPSEVYVPRYYDENFRPRYLASAEVINVVTVQRTFVNFNAPGAVTVVPLRALTREINPRVITSFDPSVIANSRQVLDPFAVEGVRELAIRRDDGRRRLRFARDEQAVFNRPVLASGTPEALRVRSDLARGLRVEMAPEKQKKNKLKITETPDVASSSRPDGVPQPPVRSRENDPRMAALAARAEQGDKSARREMRQLMRQEQAGQQAQQAAQQEQTRSQMKEQRKSERQQQAPAVGAQEAARQQRQAQQQQVKQQRKAERQQQAAQQGAAQQAQQQAQQQQVKQQRKAERQQQAAQQGAAQQQQMKQQRRAERQQQTAQEQVRQQQQQQQRKEQKRKPPEASVQQQQQLRQAQQQQAAQSQMAQQQREQFKAQRRAASQQQSINQAAQAAQQAQAREQLKAQRRQQQAAPQPQQNPAAAAATRENKAQRKAESRRPPQ